MAVRGAAPGAAFGWLIGSIAGLGEAALARGSSIDDGLRVFGWAAMIDGAVGAGLGAVVGLLFLSGAGRGWRVGVASGAITVGAACAVAFSEDPTVRWPTSAPIVPSARDVVIVAIDAFDPATVVSMPKLNAFATQALAIPNSFASAPERDGALAALFTGRLPPGQRLAAGGPAADVPDLARFASLHGYRTAAVFQGDSAVERRWAASFGTVVGLGPAHALGSDVPTSRLVLVDALSRLSPVPSRRAEHAAKVASAALASPTDGPTLLFVELTDEAGPAALDAALGQILEAVDARPNPTVVLVTGLRGATPVAGDLRRASLEVRSWVRFPGRSFAGQSYASGFTGVSWYAAIQRWAWMPVSNGPDFPWAFDFRVLQAPPAPQELPAADLPPGDPTACNVVGYWSSPVFDAPSWTPAGGGWTRVLRESGYALVLSDKDKPALYDDVRDPAWSTDLLPADARTCGDQPATARAARLTTALGAAWQASQDGADRVLAGAPNATMMPVLDPLAAR